MTGSSFFPPNFAERVAELQENITDCPHIQRVATPYIQAAAWEVEQDKGIESIVGSNSAVDMQVAASQLSEFALNCAGCEREDPNACVLSGVDTISPTDLVTLLTNKQENS